MVNSLSNYKEILILETLKNLKKFQNIIGINTAVIILVFLNTYIGPVESFQLLICYASVLTKETI